MNHFEGNICRNVKLVKQGALWLVYVNGSLLRTASGVVCRFENADAAELAGKNAQLTSFGTFRARQDNIPNEHNT